MIKPLTSLRFVFALMVFASHLSFLKDSKSEILRKLFDSVFSEGYIGVTFFFVLSGFILAYNYQDDFLKKHNYKKYFYIARFARIIPLHILTLFIALPLTFHSFQQNIYLWLSQAITNASLTQSFIPIRIIYFSFNAPSWSISNEMFFYLVFPFLIFLIPKIKGFNSVLILFVITFIPLLTTIVPDNYFHQIFYINPFTRIFDFILGILIFNFYRAFNRNKFSINYSFIEITSVLLILAFFIFHQSIPKVARYSFYYWIPMCFLIFSFSLQKGIISRLLSKKIFIHLGEISFAFYMFHQLVLKYILIINSKFLFINSDATIIYITLSISLIISHFSYVLFETPLNRYIKNVAINN